MSKDSLMNANFRKQTKSGGDSCLFCEYRVLSKDKNKVSCRMHNVILGVGEDYSSGEHVCDCFQESESFGMAVDLLLNDSSKNNSASAK